MLNVLWSLMVEFGSGGMASPAEVEDALLNPAPVEGAASSPAAGAPTPSVATWGTTPEAVAGQDAFMAMLGGARG